MIKELYRKISIHLISRKKFSGLKNYYNIFSGQTCAIIGNAPSLKVSDLELLQKNRIFSFATNRFYKIYDKTTFRPNCFVLSDSKMMREEYGNPSIEDSEYKMYGFEWDYLQFRKVYKKEKNNKTVIMYKKKLNLKDDKITPTISNKIADGLVGGGYTTLFEIFQIARYMGFTKFILLGVECSYTKDGSSHFYTDKKEKFDVYGHDMANKCQSIAFGEIASQFGKNKEIKIINCSTNTKLECFEIDSLSNILIK